jgi:hypothetical protein
MTEGKRTQARSSKDGVVWVVVVVVVPVASGKVVTWMLLVSFLPGYERYSSSRWWDLGRRREARKRGERGMGWPNELLRDGVLRGRWMDGRTICKS